MKKRRGTKAELYLTIKRLYAEAHSGKPATTREMIQWGLRKELCESPKFDEVGFLAREMAAALRQEVFTDPQGRRVRSNHAYHEETEVDGETEQRDLWGTFDSFGEKEMRASFQQRLDMIVGDCVHLKTDVDSYNENYMRESVIQTDFDLNFAVIQSMQPTEYAGIK